MANMDRLDSLIQSLPQELQDNIVDFYLLPKKADRVIVDFNYKPPWQLQFDRRSRRSLIPCYYSQQNFELQFGSYEAQVWFRSLPTTALKAMQTVRFNEWANFAYFSAVRATPVKYLDLHFEVLSRFPREGLTRDWLYTRIWFESDGEDECRWMNESELRVMLEQMSSSE